MGRIFRRGELKQAVLVVLESIEPAHGYAVMSDLKDRVGGGWKPSPGAIYPALLALVLEGYVAGAERDGKLMYSLTERGRREAQTSVVAGRWASLNARAESGEERIAVGSLLDTFAADSGLRRRLTNADQRREIESILKGAHDQIEQTLNQGENNG
jgi:DNA-binding PadR family transcriptional regulator